MAFFCVIERRHENASRAVFDSCFIYMYISVYIYTYLQPQFLNRDVGKHLLGVEDLLQKQEILEAQLNSQGDLLKNVSTQALGYIRQKGEQYDVLQRKLDEVNALYERFVFFNLLVRIVSVVLKLLFSSLAVVLPL